MARPTHTFTTAGIYSVTLTVTNAKGTATHTQPNLVTVAVNPPLLNAKFTATPDRRRPRRCRCSSPTRSVGGVDRLGMGLR